jgi:putative addiction module killer protein
MIRIEVTEIYDKWFKRLRDIRAKDIINSRLDRIKENENFGDCKSLGAGLYEIRIHYSGGYRLYFWHKGDRWILILCGGKKSTQEKDIKTARKIAREV